MPIRTWSSFTAPHRELGKSRKRKRHDGSISKDGDDDVPSISAQRASSSQPRPIHTLDDIAQFRVAGHEVSEAIPQHPFPHRQSRSSETFENDSQDANLQSEDSAQADEQDDPKPSRERTLRQQHMSVLVTLLHRCVMQKDYVRARRAFGLLLRHEVGGQPFDVRTGATWGIGAEILMHSNSESQLRPLPTILTRNDSMATEPLSESLNLRPSAPTRHTFELTKRYFESLSVQYGYNSSHPRMFSAVDFELAMFEFWIYTLQEELKKADVDGSRSPSSGNSDILGQDPMPDLFPPTNKATTDALESIITEANDIQGQLENLMQAPIYSNRPDYLNIYEGVKQWIGDLRSRISPRLSPGA
ncbi:MAG: hypothetical protein Q9160_004198 [Pyrenula sp. 1 TL-2023]